jgi:putative lipoic acid-binding regulatory protein
LNNNIYQEKIRRSCQGIVRQVPVSVKAHNTNQCDKLNCEGLIAKKAVRKRGKLFN